MKIGDKIHVLLPYYIQCTDDTEPFVPAVVIDARDDDGVKPAAIKVEYYSNREQRKCDLWIDLDELTYVRETAR
jgi:hypothetical protein